MGYSQNNEESWIESYFRNQDQNNLVCLDIGANDGKTLSNTLACIERGWFGCMVEPSKEVFKRLLKQHYQNEKVECFNVAIATENGTAVMFESGEHLGKGDHSLLSSLKESELARWKDETFTPVDVEVIDFQTLAKQSQFAKFDLISIDAEGLDYEILTQIDLAAYGCQMLIVESNSVEDEKYIEYAKSFGMRLLQKNFENLVFVI